MSSAIALMALAAIPLFSGAAYAQCSPVDNIKLTVYGYADGPGDTTSFGCSGSTPYQSTPQNPGVAGGKGTYDDPYTLATVAGSTMLQECEMVYIPYLKKYYRYQDHCSGCDNNHVDLWIGTDNNGGQAQLTCETTIGTSQQTIIKNPPSGLDVENQNLWDGSCHPTVVFANPNTSGMCSGGGSQGASSGSSGSSNPPASSPAASPSSYSAGPPQQSPSTNGGVTGDTSGASNTKPGSPASGAKDKIADVKHEDSQPKANPPPAATATTESSQAPTTLVTVTRAPITSEEPTGTAIPTTNGVCTTAGAAVCSTDGKQIGICNIDLTVIFMDVAPGTKCVNGGMVFANQ